MMRYDETLDEQSRYWLRGFFTACGMVLIGVMVLFLTGCVCIVEIPPVDVDCKQAFERY